MRLLATVSVLVVSFGALAYDTSGGSRQCTGVIPGAKPHYLFSKEGDRIAVRSSYSEVPAMGSESKSVVSARVTVMVIPGRNTNRVSARLENVLSAEDCRGSSFSGERTYQVQLKSCYLGNTVAFEGVVSRENRLKPVQDGFPSDGRETLAIGYLGYCPNRLVWGSSSQKLYIELNGRPATNPVGEKGAFGLKL